MKFHVLNREFCVGKSTKNNWRDQASSGRKHCSNQFWFVLFFSIVLLLSLLCIQHLLFFGKEGFVYFSSSTDHDHSKHIPIYFPRNSKTSLDNSKKNKDLCWGRYIYVHDLPKKFNEHVLRDCQFLTRASDKSSMCTYIQNSGLGPKTENSQKTNWFSTNQFLLEVIFHNRMKNYKCLTNDSTLASAVFVPYYAGLDLRRYLWGFNTSMRDSSGIELLKWLTETPEWKKMWGKDHFLVSGRISRDFRRQSDRKSEWGSNFRSMPESQNMSMLTIESGKWKNDFAIPYPTYFHPSTDEDVFQWQSLVRRQNRPYLFSFAGAPRSRRKGSIRNEIISQCQQSNTLCSFLDCDSVGHKCDDPVNLMTLFQSSVFCLQPPGDSLTRRSIFDSILAGCIPVFFHPGSAYTQYVWHLPKNHTKYSVFISPRDLREGNVRIGQRLLQVSKDDELAMREEVVRLIPRIVYADPRSSLDTVEDAFDLAIKGILKRTETLETRK